MFLVPTSFVVLLSAACQTANVATPVKRDQFGVATQVKRDQFVDQKVREQDKVNETHDSIVGDDCRTMLSLWDAWNAKKGPPRSEAKQAVTRLTIDSNISLVKVIPRIGKEERYSEQNIYDQLVGWTETNCGRIFGWEDKVLFPYTE